MKQPRRYAWQGRVSPRARPCCERTCGDPAQRRPADRRSESAVSPTSKSASLRTGANSSRTAFTHNVSEASMKSPHFPLPFANRSPRPTPSGAVLSLASKKPWMERLSTSSPSMMVKLSKRSFYPTRTARVSVFLAKLDAQWGAHFALQVPKGLSVT